MQKFTRRHAEVSNGTHRGVQGVMQRFPMGHAKVFYGVRKGFKWGTHRLPMGHAEVSNGARQGEAASCVALRTLMPEAKYSLLTNIANVGNPSSADCQNPFKIPPQGLLLTNSIAKPTHFQAYEPKLTVFVSTLPARRTHRNATFIPQPNSPFRSFSAAGARLHRERANAHGAQSVRAIQPAIGLPPSSDNRTHT